MTVFLLVLAISVLVVLPAFGLWRIRRREELERWYQNTRYIGYEHHVVQQARKDQSEAEAYGGFHVTSVAHSGNDPPSYDHSGTFTAPSWGGGESGGAGAGSDYGGGDSGSSSDGGGGGDGGGGDGGGGGGD